MTNTLRYQPISEFAPVTRDLALVVEESMECGTLVKEIKNACKQAESVELFDIYRSEQLGAGKKSMAFKITFAAGEKELTPKDIDRFVKKILGNLKFRLSVEMR